MFYPEMQILASYAISDQDESGDPKYYGFLSSDGHWYIMEENAANNTFRYCNGTPGGYAAAWTARASETYSYFSAINWL